MEIIAAVALVLILAAIGSAGYVYYQHKKRMLAVEMGQHILQTDIRALVTAAVGVGERVRELELRLRSVTERQEQQELNEPASQSYQQARKLARRGADMGELVDVYGLTQGEAELISILNRMETEQAAPDGVLN